MGRLKVFAVRYLPIIIGLVALSLIIFGLYTELYYLCWLGMIVSAPLLPFSRSGKIKRIKNSLKHKQIKHRDDLF